MKKRLLTGDRPTGRLHLGHWVGSIQQRVRLQEEYEAAFLIADLHTLTTRPEKEHLFGLRTAIHDVVLDWLSCGIDPDKAILYLQSAVPEVCELHLYFEMLISVNRLTGLPSIKEMARNAHIEEESIPCGLISYPVLQTADILLSKAHCVPVGKDNAAHVELARDIARRFNQYYGELFPIPELLLSEVPTLVGTDGKAKMSKSLDNTIFLSDESSVVEKKVRGMFTDPNRIRADIPGTVEGNPIFIYLDAFDLDKSVVQELKSRYRAGTVGDVEVKQRLGEVLNGFLAPLRERRAYFAAQPGYVERVLYEGTLKMREIAVTTLKEVRSAMGFSGAWNRISRIARQ